MRVWSLHEQACDMPVARWGGYKSVAVVCLCLVLQGSMELWNPRISSWGCCHFVLTRAGFLHWFKDIESTTPLEAPLNLSK